jgi:hypothetical protein
MQISGNVFSITDGKNAKETKHAFAKLVSVGNWKDISYLE